MEGWQEAELVEYLMEGSGTGDHDSVGPAQRVGNDGGLLGVRPMGLALVCGGI